jgi:hypothetical protein
MQQFQIQNQKMIMRNKINFGEALKRIFFTFFVTSVLVSCATNQSVGQTARLFKDQDVNFLTKQYEQENLGKVIFFSNLNYKDQFVNVHIYSGNSHIFYGNIYSKESYLIYLIPGVYQFTFNDLKVNGKVEAGRTLFYEVGTQFRKPEISSSVPSDVQVLASGSLISRDSMLGQIDSYKSRRFYDFKMTNDDSFTDSVQLKIEIPDAKRLVSINLNGKDRSDLVSSIDAQNQLFVKMPIEFGANTFTVTLTNTSGLIGTKSIVVTRLTDREKRAQELKEKQEAEKRAKAYEIEEKQRQLQLANDAKARKLEEERIAREGDGSSDDLLCKKYGFKPQSNGYAECRMKVDFAKAESIKQQQQYEREQAVYEQQLAAIEQEKERRRGAAFMELGARMMSGQRTLDAINSVGTGAPIAPRKPASYDQTITLPNGRMINCSTFGTMTNCF